LLIYYQGYNHLNVNNLQQKTLKKIKSLALQHRLPDTYADDVVSFVMPIAEQLFEQHKNTPAVIGIQGSQGSGKSTSAAFLKKILESEFNLNVEICSIDDFYLSRAERKALAEKIHPLLQTRGVPGTHHTQSIIHQFNLFKENKALLIPQFDKSIDNPKPKSEWLTNDGRTDILIFEGWCVGVTPQKECELIEPVNELESNEDNNQLWRTFVNNKLANEYSKIFKQLDSLIVLQAPSFDCVYEWRQLQEDKLIANLKTNKKSTELTLNSKQIKRFIQHYQRLTEHALLSLKDDADFILHLNSNHRITSLENKKLKRG